MDASAVPQSPEPPAAPVVYAIAAVERETGLSKDTLRMWERRYGFPVPARDAKGERVYCAEQVARLRHLQRLVQTGHRPGQVVPLDAPALKPSPQGRRSAKQRSRRAAPVLATSPLSRNALQSAGSRDDARIAPALGSRALAERVSACLACVASHDPTGLRAHLTGAILDAGLESAVLYVVAPLTQQVGQAWAEGRFEVYEEHLYTECVSGVLRAAIAGVPAQSAARSLGPRVLLTTASKEQHGLGLLMLEAVLSLRGCVCLSLGTEMPITDIARAAQVFQSDIVALSFSGILAAHHVQADLAALRQLLAPSIELWAGGQGTHALQSALGSVRILPGLEGVESALAAFSQAGAHPG